MQSLSSCLIGSVLMALSLTAAYAEENDIAANNISEQQTQNYVSAPLDAQETTLNAMDSQQKLLHNLVLKESQEIKDNIELFTELLKAEYSNEAASSQNRIRPPAWYIDYAKGYAAGTYSGTVYKEADSDGKLKDFLRNQIQDTLYNHPHDLPKRFINGFEDAIKAICGNEFAFKENNSAESGAM